MNRFVSLAVLLALIVLLGSMFYQVIAPFILPLFLAAVLAVMCQPLQNFFLKKVRDNSVWAAMLTTCTVIAVVVLPLVLTTFIGAKQIYNLADKHLGTDWQDGLNLIWTQTITPLLQRLEPLIPGGVSDEKIVEWRQQFALSLQSAAATIGEKTFRLASTTLSTIVSMAVAAGMFITALYYFLADGRSILVTAEELIPLPVEYQRRFAEVVRAVVTATFLAAFAQGLATAVALWMCGLGHFWVFLVIGSIASLIPLAGAWMVWGPCAVWLLVSGHWPAAVALTIWGFAVVGLLDNGVKIYVLQSNADLHPLLAFISVIGALQVMGLWGIFIGPIVASCLFALIQIFNEELKAIVKEREKREPTTPVAAAPAVVVPIPGSETPIASSNVVTKPTTESAS